MGAMGGALEDAAGALTGAAPGWIVLGVVLHLANQLARGLGWHSIVCSARGDAPAPRRRDSVCAWVAGAGAGGILSARGGDAVRVLVLSRRVPGSRGSVLAGTLVAEAAGDTLVGVAVLVLAVGLGVAPALGFGLPGAATAAWIAVGLLLLALACSVAKHRHEARAPRPPGRLRRIAAGVGCGCAPLTRPGSFACRVLPWQIASRALRAAALACFLAAFHLPATVAAVLLVMLAQSGGRLVPLAPASVGASVGMLAAGFGPVTGAAVSATALAGFLIGMSTVLTLAGVLAARRHHRRRRRPARRGRGAAPAPPGRGPTGVLAPGPGAPAPTGRCGSPHGETGGCTAATAAGRA